MATPSALRLPSEANNTGNRVANWAVNFTLADGSATTLYLQAVTVTDSDGFEVDLRGAIDTLQDIRSELRAIRRGISVISNTMLDPEDL